MHSSARANSTLAVILNPSVTMELMRVAEVMSKPAVAVPPDMSVADVASTLLKHRVRAVPVVDPSGKLLGIISDMDLLVRNAHLHFPTFLGLMESLVPIGGDRNLNEELRRVLGVAARDVMTKDVRTATPDDDLGEVAHDMSQRHLHAIPVVKDGKVEGMLFPTDIVRLIAKE